MIPDQPRAWAARVGLAIIVAIYLHNTLPHLTMLPRVNVDEPWLMERAYQVLTTGVPSQPMLRLEQAYLLQPGYGFVYAPWFGAFGVGMFQARLLSVLLGLGAVLFVAGIGRRLVTAEAGLLAAAFLAADSNFLGNARMSRTDMVSVFFAVAALWCFVRARESRPNLWHALSGASAGVAMLCHANAYWVLVVLIGWHLVESGLRVWRSTGFAMFALGGLVSFGPYLVILFTRLDELRMQVGNFAAGRAPSLSPAVILEYVTAEVERYSGWYFGLVTNTVPNPLLWAFQAAAIAGVVFVLWQSVRLTGEARRSFIQISMLSVGTIVIFAGFIPNKAHVYLPNLLIGLSLAAGAVIDWIARSVVSVWARRSADPALRARASAYAEASADRRSLGEGWLARAAWAVPLAAALLYSVASVAYYEKWYSTQRSSELEPYESTERSLRALIPPGSADILASPHFWVPFHAQPGMRMIAYTGVTPVSSAAGRVQMPGVGDGRPIYLLIDESEWRPAITDARFGYAEDWRDAWARYVTEQCALRAVAYGTAFGNIASFECSNGAPPARGAAPAIIGLGERFVAGPPVWAPSLDALAALPPYLDERRPTGAPPPRVEIDGDAVRISGTEWPGVHTELRVTPGGRYLLTFEADRAAPGDLLYLGHWDRRQVQSLSGSSSAGIFTTLATTPWFPSDRAFIATADRVWLRVYAEAPRADFRLRSLALVPLSPAVP